jgi:PAS domain S-box-containing protein
LGEPEFWPDALVNTLRLVLNTTQPICFWWGPQLINFHNDAYEPMLGNRKDGAIGKSAPELWPDVWEDVLPLVEKALRGEATSLVDLPLVVTRNGYEEASNWTFSYSPVFDDNGNVAGMMNIVVESTEAVRTREELSQAYEAAREHIRVQLEFEEQRAALQAELAHRMKNTIAMTQAVVSQSLRHSKSVEEAAETVNGRLVALAQAQSLLVQGGQRAAIREVVERTLEPHRDHEGRFVLDGPDFILEAQQAMGITLALHELATNAAKYGAQSVADGFVSITWSAAEPQFTLMWKESGGPPVVAPSQPGFGSRLKDRIVPSYFKGSGKTIFEPDGVRYLLTGRIMPGESRAAPHNSL